MRVLEWVLSQQRGLEMLKWKLLYREGDNNPPILVGEYLIPHEAMEAGNAYASCDLVWGTSPEGHLHSEIPHPGPEISKRPFSSLQLRNPYYDYWRAIESDRR